MSEQQRLARAFILLSLALLFGLIAVYLGCNPSTKLPPAPITRAPTLTPTVTATWTIHPTITWTATNTPTFTLTHSPMPTNTSPQTNTATATFTSLTPSIPTTMPTIQAGRNQLTPPPLPNTGASAADIARMTRTHR